MNVMILMIPMALILATAFVSAFLWAVNRGQFDDLETPAHRILDDDNERNNK